MDQSQPPQQAYDRGSTIFSPDGRLYQVEYAREAVKRGSTSVGLRTNDGVVLAAFRKIKSPLLVPDSVEKTHVVDEHVAAANAGHVADARHLIDVARRDAQENRFAVDRPIGVETLTHLVTEYIQEFTQKGGRRPFGVALLLGGVSEGRARLFEIDPSGTSYEWEATAIGRNTEETRAELEEIYSEDLDLAGGIGCALEALAPSGEELTPDNFDVTTISTDPVEVQTVPDEELEGYLAELDVDGFED